MLPAFLCVCGIMYAKIGFCFLTSLTVGSLSYPFSVSVIGWRNSAVFLEIASEDRLVGKVQLIGNFLDAESGLKQVVLCLQQGECFYPLDSGAS